MRSAIGAYRVSKISILRKYLVREEFMKNTALWIIAFIITVSAAIYQRYTGPTYTLRGKVNLHETIISYKLARSHGGESDHIVRIKAEDPDITGFLVYRRFKTEDPWQTVAMLSNDGYLTGKLPHQPPAGKLEYKVMLYYDEQEVLLTEGNPVVIRFKGGVPAAILLPHILIMFAAMLVSTRAGIEALNSSANPRKYAIWTTVLLLAGGMILGPLVQKFAFGQLWTGFPFGHDLTDNKTLIAFIGWIAALIAGCKGKPARWWVFGAAVLLLIIYLIPHSLLGSELDYSQTNVQ